MKLSDRERKLLILAFDLGSTAGEAMNALRVVFRNWITKYPDGHELVKDLEGREGIERKNSYGEVVLGFGKFRGSKNQEMPSLIFALGLEQF